MTFSQSIKSSESYQSHAVFSNDVNISFCQKYVQITPDHHKTMSDFFHIKWSHCSFLFSPFHRMLAAPLYCILFRLMECRNLWAEVPGPCNAWIQLPFCSLPCHHCQGVPHHTQSVRQGPCTVSLQMESSTCLKSETIITPEILFQSISYFKQNAITHLFTQANNLLHSIQWPLPSHRNTDPIIQQETPH